MLRGNNQQNEIIW